MKKYIVLFLTCLLVLTSGCAADNKANISDRKEVVISVEGKDYNKGQFYDVLVSNNVESIILNRLVEMVYAVEVSDDSTDIDKEVEEAVKNFTENYGDFADAYLQIMGYVSLEDYRNDLSSSFKLEGICKKYVGEHFDEFMASTNSKKARIIDVDSLEKAEEVISKVKEGQTLEALAEEYESSTYTGEEKIIFDGYMNLPESIKLALENAKVGLVETPFAKDGENPDTYYVVEFTDVDANNFKDELTDAWLNSEKIEVLKILGIYAKKGNFKIYDEDVYNSFVKNYPDLFD